MQLYAFTITLKLSGRRFQRIPLQYRQIRRARHTTILLYGQLK